MVALMIKATTVVINIITKIRITITITEKNDNSNGNKTATQVSIKTQTISKHYEEILILKRK